MILEEISNSLACLGLCTAGKVNLFGSCFQGELSGSIESKSSICTSDQVNFTVERSEHPGKVVNFSRQWILSL